MRGFDCTEFSENSKIDQQLYVLQICYTEFDTNRDNEYGKYR